MCCAGASRHTSRSRSSIAQAFPQAAGVPSPSSDRARAKAAAPRAPPPRPLLLAKVHTDKGRTAGIEIVLTIEEARGGILLVQGILDIQANRPERRKLPAGTQVEQPKTTQTLFVDDVIVAVVLHDPGAAQ